MHKDIKDKPNVIKTQKVQLHFRHFNTHQMKRTGRRLQPMESNGIVHNDITKTGPPPSDAHLYCATGLRRTQIDAVRLRSYTQSS